MVSSSLSNPHQVQATVLMADVLLRLSSFLPEVAGGGPKAPGAGAFQQLRVPERAQQEA